MVAGERVAVHPGDPGDTPAVTLAPERLLHVDGDLVVVDKPAGVPAQPTRATDRWTLPALAEAATGGPIRIVHRLDRETSGVTVLAASDRAAAALSAAFAGGAVEKTYLALCARAPDPPGGRVDEPIGGQPAATRYRTLAVGAAAALVEAHPETGRTHQVRIHLAGAGAPLLGDRRYGGPARIGDVEIGRVMLHAVRLAVPHPATGAPVTFEAPVPADFAALAAALTRPA
jgi:23S rRNA pseudouridine1911/1915/1917 synthase